MTPLNHRTCQICGTEYNELDRVGKVGKVIHCEDCAEECGEPERYTGNMIYCAKTNGSIQINSSSKLTSFINNSTKLKNKGANLGANLNACAQSIRKTENACLVTADTFSYKK